MPKCRKSCGFTRVMCWTIFWVCSVAFWSLKWLLGNLTPMTRLQEVGAPNGQEGYYQVASTMYKATVTWLTDWTDERQPRAPAGYSFSCPFNYAVVTYTVWLWSSDVAIECQPDEITAHCSILYILSVSVSSYYLFNPVSDCFSFPVDHWSLS